MARQMLPVIFYFNGREWRSLGFVVNCDSSRDGFHLMVAEKAKARCGIKP